MEALATFVKGHSLHMASSLEPQVNEARGSDHLGLDHLGLDHLGPVGVLQGLNFFSKGQ